MEKYYRMVIDLYREVLLINRVNPDREGIRCAKGNIQRYYYGYNNQ